MSTMLDYVYNDGGRSKYFKGQTDDCVVRALAIATQRDYKEIYNIVRNVTGESPRKGVRKKHAKVIAARLGGKWIPKMRIGSGCTCHLRTDELPKGRIVCCVAKHWVAVIDHVVNDTWECDDPDTCVYGYWVF